MKKAELAQAYYCVVLIIDKLIERRSDFSVKMARKLMLARDLLHANLADWMEDNNE